MKEVLGFYLICSAIVIFIMFILGYDYKLKEKIAGVIGAEFILALLMCGAYLLIG